MFQAITVKYLAPTSHLGARWKARCAAGSIIIAQADNLNPDNNAIRAAKRLCDKLKWQDMTFYGGMDYNGSYVFVIMRSTYDFIV